MKVSKAIEVLTQYWKGTNLLYLPDFPDAVKLGIEALEKWQSLRELGVYYCGGFLPGETPEEEVES